MQRAVKKSAPPCKPRMDPTCWGPTFWRVMHAASFEAARDVFSRLVKLLQLVLPCPHCRTSFVAFCREFPQSACASTDPDAAAMWMWRVHDMVNVKLQKPCIGFRTLKRRYAAFRSQVTDDDMWSVVFVSALALEPKTDASVRAVAELGACLSDALRSLQRDTSMRACSFLQQAPDGACTASAVFEHYVSRRAAYDTACGLPAQSADSVRDKYKPCDASLRVAPEQRSAGASHNAVATRRRAAAMRRMVVH